MIRTSYKKITAAVLVLSFIIPASFSLSVKNTEAQVSIVNDPINLVENAISAVSTAASQVYNYTLQYKETVLDGIAWYVAKAILRQMTTSIVTWINSGFNGNPSFVTDPAGFFVDIADQEIVKFIEGSSDLNFLCKPFSIDIRIALAFRYSPFKQKITCTFSGVIKNAKSAANNFDNSFIKGNFQDGGWKNWISLTTQPQNNYIGAYLQAQDELAWRIGSHQASAGRDAGWGNGFLSWKTCTAYADTGTTANSQIATDPETGDTMMTSGTNTGQKVCVHEEVQTPGKVINSGLEKALGAGIDQLNLADEFNEIVNALFAQLLTQVLSGGNGLRGTSGGGTYDSSAYINRLSQEQTAQDIQQTSNIKNDTLKGIDSSITQETTYKQNKDNAEAAVLTTKSLLQRVDNCYKTKLTTVQTPPLTPAQISLAQSRKTDAESTITQSIDPIEKPLLADIDQSNALLMQLYKLRSVIQAANSVNDMATTTEAYARIVQGGSLHDTRAVVVSESDGKKIAADMNTLGSQVNVKMVQCQDFPKGTSAIGN